ncbi:hypothetical protein Poly51_56950 [Rubripirellula tenax]|uniref:Uncharacterized protein n=1 Tax=Rubripirellula tenax TaxID=2528015 RepID=A0A5C6EGE1_9BACT|nr:hypothetical protein Poly51_56950 [Rubripirellula tenax]
MVFSTELVSTGYVAKRSCLAVDLAYRNSYSTVNSFNFAAISSMTLMGIDSM